MRDKRTEQILIRRAVEADLSAVLDIFRQSVSISCRNDYNPDQLHAWTASADNRERWKAMIGDQYFIVAEQMGGLAGFASLKEDFHLHLLFVAPAFQRKGVAGRLLKALIERANQNEQRKLTADVSITARPFFEAVGFTVLFAREASIAGQLLSNFRMELNL